MSLFPAGVNAEAAIAADFHMVALVRLPVRSPLPRREESDIEHQARADYRRWKRMIRSTPMEYDVNMMDDRWSSALSREV